MWSYEKRFGRVQSPPCEGADGVTVSSYRLFKPNGLDKSWLETTTPSAPAKERAVFFMAQPPLLRKAELSKLRFTTEDQNGAEPCIRSAKPPRFAIKGGSAP